MILSNLHRITLTPRAVQEHMKGDPEYGAAVQCLQICECTFEDVEPFNSHILKSTTKEDGVDMGKPFHFAAATIVQTNLLHETLTLEKHRQILTYITHLSSALPWTNAPTNSQIVMNKSSS